MSTLPKLGGARFGNGAVDFAVGGADDPAGLGHGTVDLAVGGVYGAARFGQGPGDLPVGRVAGRVDDSPGFGQKLFQFVTGGRPCLRGRRGARKEK